MTSPRIKRKGDAVAHLNKLVVAMHGSSVKVGVVQAVGGSLVGDGLTLAGLAAIHEFGTDTIPERSFIRSGAAQSLSQIRRMLRRMAKRVVRGEARVAEVLKLMGQLAQARMQAIPTSGQLVPNAPATIAKKGSNTPLIDTGHLRQSISYEVQLTRTAAFGDLFRSSDAVRRRAAKPARRGKKGATA